MGQTPGNSDLKKFCNGLADGSVSDVQAAAFAMAVCLKGLDIKGRKDLTLSMRDSGGVIPGVHWTRWKQYPALV